MKKGRRANEQPVSNVSSDTPSTPDYDLNQENILSDEFSSGMDFKTVPLKAKKISGWTDEASGSRSGSSGKYVFYYRQIKFNIYQCFFILKIAETETSQRQLKCKFISNTFLKKINFHSILILIFQGTI